MRISCLFFLVIVCRYISSQNISVSGKVFDKKNGEVLVGATVYSKARPSQAVFTNNYGLFSINLPVGSHTLVIQYIGYAKKEIPVEVTKQIHLNIEMTEEGGTTLNEVEVVGEKNDENVTQNRMSTVKLEMHEVKKIPAFLGEVDILKTIQLLPGVKNAGDGNTGFYVRGGGPDQNLILLDDAPVYNASHLMGFFSVFNGDAIKNVNLIKGGMPAEYGGRLASVLDITTKDGNNRYWEAEGGIGVIASRITVQGPLKKEKSSIILSGRRTYVDVIAKPWLEKTDFKGTSYFFYDMNLKWNYILNEKNKIYLSGYYGKDVFQFNSVEDFIDTRIPWGNATLSARWNHIFNSKLFSNLTFAFSDYNFKFEAFQDDFEGKFFSGIRDFGLKYDLYIYPNSRHNIRAGIHHYYHIFTPTNVSAKQGETVFDLGKVVKLYSHESSVYISDDWTLRSNLKLNLGFRYNHFFHVGPFTRYLKNFQGKITDTLNYRSGRVVSGYPGPEPRASMTYIVSPSLSFKASYTRNYQFIHLATLSSVSLPTDVWMPCTEVIKPQIGNQYAAGIFKNFKDNLFETSVEVYYKDMKNQIEYKEGAEPSDNVYDNPDNAFTFGKGWAYGAEFFIRKSKGKLTGWIGYTLSWTLRQFDEINYGLVFPAKYDRRHDASLVLTYEPLPFWNFGIVWVYATGNRGTLPNGFFLFEGSMSNDYGLRNSYQFVPYHRMDISATFSFSKHKEWKKSKIISADIEITTASPENKRKLNHSLTLSVFNVYNRYNPYFIYFSRQGDLLKGDFKVVAKQVTLFPILPSLTWNFKF
ncbi:MAG: TonB-dependent receptor [Bacteroidia bacterium]|nr:TonB-dependent receptor [Bacteroidia bacterium]